MDGINFAHAVYVYKNIYKNYMYSIVFNSTSTIAVGTIADTFA